MLYVGAATEIEMKEKKARVEDALNATRAAVQEGIVPGGGVALLRTLEAVRNLDLEGDEAFGRDIILNALQAPIRAIAKNAGVDAAVVAVAPRRRASRDAPPLLCIRATRPRSIYIIIDI